MKLLRALFYQYYWWQMRRENDEFFVPLLAVLCLLIPIFGIAGFIAIVVDVTGLITLQKYDMKLFIFAIFVLGFAILWYLFLRKKRYRAIAQDRDIYDTSIYRKLSVIYPVLSAILFFIGLYIGFIHNTSMIGQ